MFSLQKITSIINTYVLITTMQKKKNSNYRLKKKIKLWNSTKKMRPPRMIPTLSRVRNLPNAEFVNPPLPGLDVEQVCRKPIEITMKKSDVTTNKFSISSASFGNSSLRQFLVDFSIDNFVEIDGMRVHVVGEAGDPAMLRLYRDSTFYNLSCDNNSWNQLCMSNNLKEGDKVGLWLFTRNNVAHQLWMAMVLTQRRTYRSIRMM